MKQQDNPNTTSRQRPKIVEYEEDGFKVTEMTFPDSNTYMMTKEKDGTVYYYYRSTTGVTKGAYNKAEFERRMADFNRQMDEWNAQWNNSLKNWNQELDKRLSHSFGYTIPTMPDFPDIPTLPVAPKIPGTSETILESDFTDFDDLFDSELGYRSSRHRQTGGKPYNSSFYSSEEPTRVYYSQKSSSGSSGCLGCLVWTVLILCIVCIILYGMGVIGGNIINFIGDLFKSLF